MDRLKTIILISTIFSFSALASLRPVSIKEQPHIKVRVAKKLKSVSIIGTDLKRTFHPNKKRKVFSGRKKVRFNCYNLSQKKNRLISSVKLASLSSPTGLISLDKNKYKGQLHVVTSESNDSCDVINEVGMEEYISSLLAKEMNSSWELEALKAQAVAARTYAMARIKNVKHLKSLKKWDNHYDLESSEKDQVSGDFNDITRRTVQATHETRGMVLSGKSGKLKPIFFHAKCGGRTLRPDQVWENKVADYKNVPCPFCHEHGKKSWDSVLSHKKIEKFLKWASKQKQLNSAIKITKSSKVFLAPDKMKNFKVRIYVDDHVHVINKSLLRRYFGRVLFPSNNFKLTNVDKGYKVFGQGLGHGVGMCQLGALDLAKKGWGYKKILAYYFPNHKLSRMY